MQNEFQKYDVLIFNFLFKFKSDSLKIYVVRSYIFKFLSAWILLHIMFVDRL